jgi:hypothetical protein
MRASPCTSRARHERPRIERTVSDMVSLQLRECCAARSGDKGDISDIALFACDADFYEAIRAQVTANAVCAFFEPLGAELVDRYELPTLLALKFVIHDVLGGGAARSLRADNLGKTMGGTLLRMAIEVDRRLAARAPRPRPPVSWTTKATDWAPEPTTSGQRRTGSDDSPQ